MNEQKPLEVFIGGGACTESEFELKKRFSKNIIFGEPFVRYGYYLSALTSLT